MQRYTLLRDVKMKMNEALEMAQKNEEKVDNGWVGRQIESE